MTNPPFGKKSNVLIVNEQGDHQRQPLTAEGPNSLAQAGAAFTKYSVK